MKWCIYALVLLTPGSFIVLALYWLVRLWLRISTSPGGHAARNTGNGG